MLKQRRPTTMRKTQVTLTLLLFFALLSGCAHWQTPATEREKALDIINYGFSHKLGHTSYDKVWEKLKYGKEGAKFLDPNAYGSGYCFDCDMRRRGVSEVTLKQWHEVVADQLRVVETFTAGHSTVYRGPGITAGGILVSSLVTIVPVGEREVWSAEVVHTFHDMSREQERKFRERVVQALTSREDFRRHVLVFDASLPPTGNNLMREDYDGKAALVSMALENVFLHAARCLSGYDACY
jgi:hypothetical protein